MFEEPRPHVISSMAYLVSRVLVSLVRAFLRPCALLSYLPSTLIS